MKRSGVVSAAAEAELLVRHFSGADRIDFFTGQKVITPRIRKFVETALKVRLKGCPLQYVLKQTEFFGYSFFVNSDTLIPRPETEILVEESLRILKGQKTPKILDVGAGTGCIAVSLTIQRPDCRMTALDRSPKALEIARKNINFHGLSKKIKVLKSDLFNAFGANKKDFWDLIVSNPPYVPTEDFPSLSREVLSEPRLALDGGLKGMAVIDRLLKETVYFLKKDGWLLIEIGKGQANLVTKKLSSKKEFGRPRFIKDYTGIERVLVVQKIAE